MKFYSPEIVSSSFNLPEAGFIGGEHPLSLPISLPCSRRSDHDEDSRGKEAMFYLLEAHKNYDHSGIGRWRIHSKGENHAPNS